MLTTSAAPIAIQWTCWDEQGKLTPNNRALAFRGCPPGFRSAGAGEVYQWRSIEGWDGVAAMFRRLAQAPERYQLMTTSPRVLTPSVIDRNIVNEVSVLRQIGVQVDAPAYDAWLQQRLVDIDECERMLNALIRGVVSTVAACRAEDEREQVQRQRLAEWLKLQEGMNG